MNFEKIYKKTSSEYKGKIFITPEEFLKKKILPITTGSIMLDLITGVGGFPKGRITEMFGDESSCKTTIALLASQKILKSGGKVAYIDQERALTPAYCQDLGINLKALIKDPRFVIVTPESAEDALDIIDDFSKADDLDLIVLDSIAAMSPQAEQDASSEDSLVALLARKLGPMFRKSTSREMNPALLLLNQTRKKIGFGFGENMETPGGSAIRFFASLRIRLKKIGLIQNSNKDKIGFKTECYIVKSKVAKPFRKCILSYYFGKLFRNSEDIIFNAQKVGLIKTFDDNIKYDGKTYSREKFVEYLKSNREDFLKVLSERL